MIRDQAVLVRPDGSVMFDSPAPKARQGVESQGAWHERTVRKALAEQSKRGETLTQAQRIAPEDRPNPKVRNAIRMNALTGKLTVDFAFARLMLRDRWEALANNWMGELEKRAARANWFDLGAGIESARVLHWERQLAQVESEAKRVMDELRLAKSVEDLIAIEPRWPA